MPQLVDPFMPVNPRRPPQQHLRPRPHVAPKSPLVQNIGNDFVGPPANKRKAPPLDQLRPKYPLQRSQSTQPPRPAAKKFPGQQPQPFAKPQPAQAATKPQPVRRRWHTGVQLLLLVSMMLVAGILLQSLVAGELLIGIYAVVALIRQIESRTTFALALIALGCIVVLLLVRPDSALIKNFATYGFLFLLVGTLSLAHESRY